MVTGCKYVWPRISCYLDETLAADARKRLQEHLEHCQICAAILDSTRNILLLAADQRVMELPPGFSQRLHARLDAEMQRALSIELKLR